MSQSSRRRRPDPPSGPDGGGKRARPSDPATLDDLTDAASYLAFVRRQAGSLPDVFVAPPGDGGGRGTSADGTGRDGDGGEPAAFGSAATLAVLLSDRVAVAPPPTGGHAPPPGWVEGTVSNFSSLRTYLEGRSAALREREKKGGGSDDARRRVAVPRMKDRAGWHRFCLGRDEADGNPGGRFEVDSDGDDESDDIGADGGGKDGDPRWTAPPGGHPPTTSLLLQLDQVLTRRLFHHHVHWIVESGRELTPSRAGWVYALLARMERPWHRDECAAVRSLVRECCRRRAGADPGGEPGAVARLNVLIAAGGVYGEQGAAGGGDCRDALFAVPGGGDGGSE